MLVPARPSANVRHMSDEDRRTQFLPLGSMLVSADNVQCDSADTAVRYGVVNNETKVHVRKSLA